ncbi:hypothetical protein ACEZDB_07060 [Streptacidiphilus sp. N1-3]|uniref:Uncharacterized protein n=1 Tax=Streptacidiphilus alkalitolerans TaxID=3342712 RepID=A0ABV6WXS8_9ACTN
MTSTPAPARAVAFDPNALGGLGGLMGSINSRPNDSVLSTNPLN